MKLKSQICSWLWKALMKVRINRVRKLLERIIDLESERGKNLQFGVVASNVPVRN
jgi:hypothetical protein